MRAKALVGFLGKAILVFRIEGKESVYGAGEEVENAREVKESVSGRQQNPLVIHSSGSSPLLSSMLYTKYCFRCLYMQ